jgi:hypothetical protein
MSAVIQFRIPSTVEEITAKLCPDFSLMGMEAMWSQQEFLEEENPLITPLFFWKGEYCEHVYSKFVEIEESQELRIKTQKTKIRKAKRDLSSKNSKKVRKARKLLQKPKVVKDQNLSDFLDVLEKNILEYRDERLKVADW